MQPSSIETGKILILEARGIVFEVFAPFLMCGLNDRETVASSDHA